MWCCNLWESQQLMWSRARIGKVQSYRLDFGHCKYIPRGEVIELVNSWRGLAYESVFGLNCLKRAWCEDIYEDFDTLTMWDTFYLCIMFEDSPKISVVQTLVSLSWNMQTFLQRNLIQALVHIMRIVTTSRNDMDSSVACIWCNRISDICSTKS